MMGGQVLHKLCWCVIWSYQGSSLMQKVWTCNLNATRWLEHKNNHVDGCRYVVTIILIWPLEVLAQVVPILLICQIVVLCAAVMGSPERSQGSAGATVRIAIWWRDLMWRPCREGDYGQVICSDYILCPEYQWWICGSLYLHLVVCGNVQKTALVTRFSDCNAAVISPTISVDTMGNNDFGLAKLHLLVIRLWHAVRYACLWWSFSGGISESRLFNFDVQSRGKDCRLLLVQKCWVIHGKYWCFTYTETRCFIPTLFDGIN